EFRRVLFRSCSIQPAWFQPRISISPHSASMTWRARSAADLGSGPSELPSRYTTPSGRWKRVRVALKSVTAGLSDRRTRHRLRRIVRPASSWQVRKRKRAARRCAARSLPAPDLGSEFRLRPPAFGGVALARLAGIWRRRDADADFGLPVTLGRGLAAAAIGLAPYQRQHVALLHVGIDHAEREHALLVVGVAVEHRHAHLLAIAQD